MATQRPPRRARRTEILFFILPNLFTTGNLFFGFLSLLSSFNSKWEAAALSIMAGAFADSLDGRVARLTNAQSEFGEQYDSFADLLSFGVAPSVLMFHWALTDLGRFGWVAAFLFLVCATLRLARFNVLKQSVEKRYFQGCPSPVAAGTVASAVLFYGEMGFRGFREIYMGILMVFLGLCMVSTIRYRSFKDLKFKSQKTFAWILVSAVILAVFSPKPELLMFPILVVYVGLGPVFELFRWGHRLLFRRIRKRGIAQNRERK
jgi:CDP-diacylglycerol--serine O-phosphatidyltransferase